MATLLPKKADPVPLAADDEHHDLMAADPTISNFPQGSSFGTVTTPTTPTTPTIASSTFASSTGGFGSTGSSFGTTGAGFGGGFGTISSSNNMGSVGTSNINMGSINQPTLTGAGTNAAVGGETLVNNDNTDWINKKWRPMLGWVYMTTCITDFIIFPILWSLLQALSKGQVTSQWQPLTLQGAGLFHIAMGTFLGIAAYGRTKEKLADKQ
jgi:hypothetical protein